MKRIADFLVKLAPFFEEQKGVRRLALLWAFLVGTPSFILFWIPDYFNAVNGYHAAFITALLGIPMWGLKVYLDSRE